MMPDSTIAVVTEIEDGRPAASVFELLAVARRIADAAEVGVCAYVPGLDDPEALAETVARGADKVCFLPPRVLAELDPDTVVSVIVDAMADDPPSMLLMAHSNTGADLAPRFAARMRGAIATGCEALALDGDRLLATRPCFGGRARQVLWLRELPAVATIRPKTVEPLAPDDRRRGDVVEIAVDIPPRRVRTIGYDHATRDGPALDTARVVVAGGRGLGGPEGFETIRILADTLGGVVGASRVPCDLGWCPHSWQVGLTGKSVAPELYVAVGISGASQHMAGCGKAKAIVAINNDAEAPIFADARFGLIGDYREIVPALVEELGKAGRSHKSMPGQ
jgi:electron transfer flavoprotein alpha subunit